MAKPGSEAAHQEKLRELAGPEAGWIFEAPRKYPDCNASAVEALLAEGNVCLVETSPSTRVLAYCQDGVYHGLVTEWALGGYRRRYEKVSRPSVEELLASSGAR